MIEAIGENNFYALYQNLSKSYHFKNSFDTKEHKLKKLKKFEYYKENDTGLAHLEGRYLLVPKICGDCTVLGSNIKPDFWVD